MNISGMLFNPVHFPPFLYSLPPLFLSFVPLSLPSFSPSIPISFLKHNMSTWCTQRGHHAWVSMCVICLGVRKPSESRDHVAACWWLANHSVVTSVLDVLANDTQEEEKEEEADKRKNHIVNWSDSGTWPAWVQGAHVEMRGSPLWDWGWVKQQWCFPLSEIPSGPHSVWKPCWIPLDWCWPSM